MVNLPLLTIPLSRDRIMIQRILIGRITSKAIENTDEASFGEAQL
jgi:hypothetical protein